MARISDAKERLLASALDLIYERSYAEVGVQALCDRAGVKKGNFYHFFQSKQDLLLQALERHAQDLGAVLATAFDQSVPPLQRIDRLFERIYLLQKSCYEQRGRVCGCFFGNVALELSTQDDLIRRRVDKIFQGLVCLVENSLREAIASGQLEAVDVAASAQAILAYLEGIVLFAKLRNDPTVMLTLAKDVKTLTIPSSKSSQQIKKAV